MGKIPLSGLVNLLFPNKKHMKLFNIQSVFLFTVSLSTNVTFFASEGRSTFQNETKATINTQQLAPTAPERAIQDAGKKSQADVTQLWTPSATLPTD